MRSMMSSTMRGYSAKYLIPSSLTWVLVSIGQCLLSKIFPTGNLLLMNTLERFRKAHHLTYEAMASMVGLGPPSVWRHCQGLRRVSPSAAKRYERAFGIPAHVLRPDIFDGPSEPAPG
ncbi:helix-turn-helix domain-containing protein [Desulfobaculum xiamenense]|uniref:helix-turn-helix domain-containing protein n=1 Tax=Desulfobaculum xiamenense TaxID=995050 RepID=UPI003CC9189F